MKERASLATISHAVSPASCPFCGPSAARVTLTGYGGVCGLKFRVAGRLVYVSVRAFIISSWLLVLSDATLTFTRVARGNVLILQISTVIASCNVSG